MIDISVEEAETIIAFIKNHMENNWYDSDGPLENITHWMPLPEPPEVK